MSQRIPFRHAPAAAAVLRAGPSAGGGFLVAATLPARAELPAPGCPG